MKIKQHPGTGLWCREDGRVILPPCKKYPKFRWTFGSKGKNGYLRVKFRGKQYWVHRLVAETFIPNPNGYKEVDHYPDRTPSNNAVSNLRWADRKMQNNNRQICKDSLAKYGVRRCEDKNAYKRALYANNPEYAKRKRARDHAYYAKNAEQCLARERERHARYKALGKHRRKCPDGSRHWLTDEEFDALYAKKG